MTNDITNLLPGKMFDIKDRIVLITGAAAGIGASVVRYLLEENIKHVTILDIDEENGRAIQKELNTKYGCGKVRFIKCDITEEQELQDAFRTVESEQGYIDVVINNAGIGNDKTFVKEIEVNFTALVNSSLQAWNVMRKDKGGRGGTLINISSITALGSFPVIPIYSATKSAVMKFSTMLGSELYYSLTNVRVLTICFGVTVTNMITKEKSGSFDPIIEHSIIPFLERYKNQTSDQAAQGLTEVYKNGASGSVWVVSGGSPAIDVTEKHVQTVQIFDDVLFN